MKNAYRACKVSKSTKGNHGGRALHVYRLVTDHGIKLPQTCSSPMSTSTTTEY
jgi:hypothetical protein